MFSDLGVLNPFPLDAHSIRHFKPLWYINVFAVYWKKRLAFFSRYGDNLRWLIFIIT